MNKPKTYIASTDAEAQGLHAGRITLLVVPLEPQPDLSQLKDPTAELEMRRCPVLGPTHTPAEWGLHFKHDEPSAVPIYGYSSPYAPGDEIAVKEACYIAPVNFCEKEQCNRTDTQGRPRLVGYARSMDYDSVRCATDYGVRKTYPSQMPLWAVDTRILCRSVEARLVRDIGLEHALSWGLDDWWEGGHKASAAQMRGRFREEWSRRHPGLPFEESWAWFVSVTRKGA